MKKLIILLYLLLPFSLLAQQKTGYTIEGNIPGVPDGEKIIMNLLQSDDKEISKDSAIVSAGNFRLTGTVPDGPRFYVMQLGKSGKSIRLFINNGEHISIKSPDITKIDHGYLEEWVDIAGSPTFHSWTILATVDQTYRNSLRSVYEGLRKIKDSIGFDPSLVGLLMAQKDYINKAFFYEIYPKDNGPWRTGARLLMLDNSYFTWAHHPAAYSNAYDNLDNAEKNSYYGKIFFSLKDLCVSKPFPQFSLPDPEGKIVSSSDIIGKSKLTLVQFWHTGISGLKENQEELKNAYQKYHTKGLSIVGVSSDTDTLEWKIRVQAAKLPWPNVSDLKGAEGVAETVYHEGRKHFGWSTVNVLVDGEGKIVAWDVDGIELQWYLWKYLEDKKETKAPSK